MEKFSEFSKEPKVFPGNRISVNQVLNREIEVVDYRIEKSKINDGDCLILQIRLDSENYVLITGSTVLKRQTVEYASHLPFIATITKLKNYLTFS